MFAECKKTSFLKIRIKIKIIIIWRIVILFTRKNMNKIFCVFAEFDAFDSGLNL